MIWNLGPGIRDSEFGIQDLGPGIWDSGSGTWDLGPRLFLFMIRFSLPISNQINKLAQSYLTQLD